eukprot:g23423.t1
MTELTIGIEFFTFHQNCGTSVRYSPVLSPYLQKFPVAVPESHISARGLVSSSPPAVQDLGCHMVYHLMQYAVWLIGYEHSA